MTIQNNRQIKAARALAGWSQTDLANHAGLSVPTVARIETMENGLRSRYATVQAIQAALEAAGIEFLNGGAPGVRRHPPADA